MFSGLANYLFGSTNSDTGNISNQKNENQFYNEEDHKNKPKDDFKFLSIETDDDDWLIVDKEEEESLPRTDSEEELPFVEIKKSPKTQRPRNHQRHNNRGGSGGQNNNVHLTNPNHQQRQQQHRHNDGTTQSLYVVPSNALAITANNVGIVHHMEESWFLTPPPCFTSTGPVNMETSPFENLLIEHPSMSVYHSIRSAQEAAESFVNLDLGIEESLVQPNPNRSPVRNNMPIVARNSNRVEHLNKQQVKEILLLRNSQKVQDKKERQYNCRGAIKRGNKVREFNSKSGRPRRSDQQHCKILSGVNNNRKC